MIIKKKGKNLSLTILCLFNKGEDVIYAFMDIYIYIYYEIILNKKLK